MFPPTGFGSPVFWRIVTQTLRAPHKRNKTHFVGLNCGLLFLQRHGDARTALALSESTGRQRADPNPAPDGLGFRPASRHASE